MKISRIGLSSAVGTFAVFGLLMSVLNTMVSGALWALFNYTSTFVQINEFATRIISPKKPVHIEEILTLGKVLVGTFSASLVATLLGLVFLAVVILVFNIACAITKGVQVSPNPKND